MGIQLTPKKGHSPLPQFLAHVYCGNGCMDQVATWCGDRPQPRLHCVRWGPRSTPKGHSHSAHFFSQMAGWIAMPLGTKVGFGSGHIVLDGAQLPPHREKRGTAPPSFWPMSVVAKWLRISATAEHLFHHHEHHPLNSHEAEEQHIFSWLVCEVAICVSVVYVSNN